MAWLDVLARASILRGTCHLPPAQLYTIRSSHLTSILELLGIRSRYAVATGKFWITALTYSRCCSSSCRPVWLWRLPIRERSSSPFRDSRLIRHWIRHCLLYTTPPPILYTASVPYLNPSYLSPSLVRWPPTNQPPTIRRFHLLTLQCERGTLPSCNCR